MHPVENVNVSAMATTACATSSAPAMRASNVHASMRIVDIYRRAGDKLAENWVFIDLLHYLFEHGLDVLERMRQINRT